MQPTPCKLAREIEMDFLVFLLAYEREARISGAFEASGASMKLTKNAGTPVSVPNSLSTSTIGSENSNTTSVPVDII